MLNNACLLVWECLTFDKLFEINSMMLIYIAYWYSLLIKSFVNVKFIGLMLVMPSCEICCFCLFFLVDKYYPIQIRERSTNFLFKFIGWIIFCQFEFDLLYI